MTTHRAAAIAVLAFASFIDLMDVTIVNVALPSMQQSLGATAAELEWVVGGYALAFAALLVTGARLGDRFGRRRVFVLGVLGFTAGSLLAVIAPTAGLLVTARVLQGAFAALMVPQLLSTVQALFAPAERAPVFGVVGGLAGLAAVAGPLLGGWLVTDDVFGLGWRSIFVINLPIGVVVAVLALLVVPDTRAGSHRADRLDPVGVALLTVGIGAVVLGLVEGRQLGWPWWIVACLVGGPLVLALFVVQQRRRERAGRPPLVPIGLFADRGFSAGLVTQLVFQAAMVGFFLVLAVYLQLGLGWDAWRSGLALLPFSIGGLVGSGIAIPLTGRLGKLLPLVGALAMAAGTAASALAVAGRGGALGIPDLIVPMGLAGVGLGLLIVPLVDIALATVPPASAGAASGVYSTGQQVGAALGVAVVGLVFFTAAAAGDLRTAFVDAAIVVAIGFAICGVASLLLPSRAAVRRHQAAELAAATS